jgi:hypothetical protein
MEKIIATERIPIKTGIKALLSIRDFENTKIKYTQQLNDIESNIETLTQTALAIIKGRSTSKSVEKGGVLVHEIRESFDSLLKTLNAIKIRIELRNRIVASDLWNKMHIHLEKLKDSFANLDDFGYTFLQDSEVSVWKKNMNNVAILIMPTIFSFVESSKLELKIIESYSVEDLNKILNTILSYFHKGFDFDEADSFQSDYLVPLKNLELDFKNEKKLWATFSAILNN